MPPGQVMTFIVGTIVILFGAYYVTYYVGMKASGRTSAGIRNKNIKLIDRYAISRDKQFCIVEIAGKVYFVGVTNQGMTLLDTFDAEDYAKLTEDNEDTTPWNMTPVGQYGNKLTRKLVAYVAKKKGKTQHSDDTVDSDDSNDSSDDSNSSVKTEFAESMRKAKQAKEEPPDDRRESPEEN
ncbi:MAG: flagellar biosynthetic protein FliO [Oscillospiraceae bacterium]|nr:flagellar biosynthetic protein FliO [Oscillospiraceae bacterium]